MASSFDVPGVFDVVISNGTDSQGYIFDDGGQQRGWPNPNEKSIHSFSPTFVPRTNTEGNYGDDKTDFFMVFSQKDWGLGEGQKYARATDNTTRRYWRGTNVNVVKPGQVTLRNAVESITAADDVQAAGMRNDITLVYATDTNLYEVSNTGAVTDAGAHGLGVSPDHFGIASDGSFDTYLTSRSGSSNGIRKWDGSSFTTFSANGAQSIAYLNNALYGYGEGNLYRWSTAGARSTLHTWRSVDGGALSVSGVVAAYGAKLLILLTGGFPNSLWVYDGVGVTKLHDYPPDFQPYMLTILNGIAYTSGRLVRGDTTHTTISRPAIHYYANGQTGTLWQAEEYQSAGYAPLMAGFQGALIFTDSTLEALCSYNQEEGGFHTIGAFTAFTGSSPVIAASQYFVFLGSQATAAHIYPEPTTVATTGTYTSSLVDFDSSLEKLFRGIKIDYDEGSGGDGGSIDIAYRLSDVDGAYTTLQTGAVSGTEYILGSVGTPIEAHSLSVKLTLNKGTSTTGPILKRVYVRAAPTVNTFHRSKIWIDCQGAGGRDSVELRDRTYSSKNGQELADSLHMFKESGLLTITDRFGTRTSIIEELTFHEIRPAEHIAEVLFREV